MKIVRESRMRENRTYGLTRGLEEQGLKLRQSPITACSFTLLYREILLPSQIIFKPMLNAFTGQQGNMFVL